MKLSYRIDLTAKRTAAAAQIDAHFEQQARALDPTPTLHAAKVAAGAEHLKDEAAARGLDPAQLLERALAAQQRTLIALAALEQQRQAAKRGLPSLDSEQVIIAYVNRIVA